MSDETTAAVDPRFDPAFQRGFDPANAPSEYVPSEQPDDVVESRSVLTPAPEPKYVVVPPHSAQVPATTATTAQGSGAGDVGSQRAGAGQARAGQAGSGQAGSEDAEGSTGEARVASIDVPQSDAPAAPAPTRNPFLLVLGVIAVVLIVAGIWIFMEAGLAFNSNNVRTTDDYMSLNAIIDAAPFVALLGIATAIGVIFMFASRYRRKN